MALTQKMIGEFAALFAKEDESIWTVGDLINRYELQDDDLERLSGEVDRSIVTLRRRAKLSRLFPGDEWDRSAAPIGVFEQLSRLDDPNDRTKLFKRRRAWTVNGIRQEIDKILEGDASADGKVVPLPVPEPEVPRTTVRVTRHQYAGSDFALKSTLDEEGVLSVMLPAPMAKGADVEVTIDAETGNVMVKVPLDVEVLESGECAAAPL